MKVRVSVTAKHIKRGTPDDGDHENSPVALALQEVMADKVSVHLQKGCFGTAGVIFQRPPYRTDLNVDLPKKVHDFIHLFDFMAGPRPIDDDAGRWDDHLKPGQIRLHRKGIKSLKPFSFDLDIPVSWLHSRFRSQSP